MGKETATGWQRQNWSCNKTSQIIKDNHFNTPHPNVKSTTAVAAGVVEIQITNVTRTAEKCFEETPRCA
jgi:hypothetical protein